MGLNLNLISRVWTLLSSFYSFRSLHTLVYNGLFETIPLRRHSNVTSYHLFILTKLYITLGQIVWLLIILHNLGFLSDNKKRLRKFNQIDLILLKHYGYNYFNKTALPLNSILFDLCIPGVSSKVSQTGILIISRDTEKCLATKYPYPIILF